MSIFMNPSLDILGSLLHLPGADTLLASGISMCLSVMLRDAMRMLYIAVRACFAGRLPAAESFWLQVTQQRPSSTMGGHQSVAGGLLGHLTSRLFLELASANPMVFAQRSLLLGSVPFLVPAVVRSPALSRLFLHKQCPTL